MTTYVRNKMIAICIMIAMLMLTDNLDAQVLSPGNLEVSAMYLPGTNFIKTLDTLSDPDRSNHARINFGYSFLLGENHNQQKKGYSNWTMNVNANYSRFEHSGDKNGLIPTALLYSELGVVHFSTMQNNWAAIQMLSAGINTDFRKVDNKDLIINGGVLFMKTYSPNFSLGFGVFAYNALSMPIVLPGFVINWQTSGSVKVLINVPTEISVAWNPALNHEIKLAFRPKNINYDTENPLVPSRRALAYWELPIGLELRKKTRQIDFMIGGGLMALRSFQFNERGLDNIFKSTPGHMYGANFFVNAGLQFHFKKQNRK